MGRTIAELDTLIRQRATKELTEQVDEAFKPAVRAVNLAHLYHSRLEGVTRADGKPLYAGEALDAIRSAVIAANTPKTEQKAVEAFLEKLDSLQQQVDDLTNF